MNIEKKCDAYEAKYTKGKLYAAAAKKNKREEVRWGKRESENTNRRELGTEARGKTIPNSH